MGKNLIFMPECHSTNDAMLLLCQRENSSPEGTVIVTRRQTAGRGQRGNSWEAEPGMNLTFSLLVKPHFLPIHRQFFLNIFVSLGIRDCLTDNDALKVQIKWPNDIFVNGRKICGILIENQIAGQLISNAVVGIGLNVNQERFTIPTATSLFLETGESHELSQKLESLLFHIERRYLQLRAGKEQTLVDDYIRHLFALNEMHQFEDASGPFTGVIRGIDPSGLLRIEQAGQVKAYGFKEVRYLGVAR